jgi:FkbM family methyltransferase
MLWAHKAEEGRVAFTLGEVFEDIPVVKVVDVGASPIDGTPIYEPLRASGGADVVGFEPASDQYARLLEMNLPRSTFLPDAIGDGQEGELKICRGPGMTSLLEPNQRVLSHFHWFDTYAEVVERQTLATRRLDDVPETADMDFLKVDVQGGEMAVFEGGLERLSHAVMVHTEVQFVPFYENQPLFADLDQLLRKAGFWFHRFEPIHSRVIKPLVVNNDIYASMSQQLWSDAVYVRPFVDFPSLEVSSLLKIAVLAHDLYGSYDLALLALLKIDEREETQRHARYLERLTEVLT